MSTYRDRRESKMRLRTRIFERDGWRCGYCGLSLVPQGTFGIVTVLHFLGAQNRTAVVDHMVPAKLGGTDEEANLIACCLSCNSAKGNRSAEWYREYLAKQREVTRRRIERDHHRACPLRAFWGEGERYGCACELLLGPIPAGRWRCYAP